jgi:hypothetical protein
MLPYVLAIAVGLSSLILFLTAFLLPDIHRQDDFFWSAIGLFYALVLWFCATSITGGLLLGQVAAVALLTSYNWQTFKLRKAIAHPEQQVNLDRFSVVNSVKSLLSGKGKVKPQPPSPPVTITEKEPILPNQAEVATASSPTEETSSSTPQNNEPILSEEPFVIETTSEPKTQETSTQSSTPSLVAAKKPGLFSNLFNFGKKKPASTTPTTKNTNSVATTKLDEPIENLVIQTGRWHHQISIGARTNSFARSRSLGPATHDWSVTQVATDSPIAEAIDKAIDWVDNNVKGDPLVKLLVVPTYYLHAFWLQEGQTNLILIIHMPDQYIRLKYETLYTPKQFLELLAQEPYATGMPLAPA